MAVNQMGLDKSRCVIIEDSGIGLGAAKAAGIRCIVTKSSYTSGEDFSGADMVVDELGDNPATGVTLSVLESLVQASIPASPMGKARQKDPFKHGLEPEYPEWEVEPKAPLGEVGGDPFKHGLEPEYPYWEPAPSKPAFGQVGGDTRKRYGLEPEYPDWEQAPPKPAFGQVGGETINKNGVSPVFPSWKIPEPVAKPSPPNTSGDPLRHRLEAEYPDWEPAQPSAPPPGSKVGGYGPTRYRVKQMWPAWKEPPPRAPPVAPGDEKDPFKHGLEPEYPGWEVAPSPPALGEVGDSTGRKQGLAPVFPNK